MRLQGRRLEHARGYNITSDGIAAGSIQVPGNGQPIILLADRQTTGGYPKIATVISADLPALGRLPMGATIAFEQVSVEVAQALRRDLFSDIERIGEKIVPIGPAAADMGPMLLHNNLISGVIDAHNWTL
jgi:allophanate hydrolase subunit 2